MPVYIAARDLAEFPIGTHQFLIIIPTSNKDYLAISTHYNHNHAIVPKNLGDGTYGFVVGAQNKGRLKVDFFERSDYLSTKEFYAPKKNTTTKWYKPDFDLEVAEVDYNSRDESQFISKLLRLIVNYIINEELESIPYPIAGFGTNSNSWAQSVIRVAGGKVKENFSGADINHKNRIHSIYFQAICPKKPRPRINK